jgi:undecaprenyl-diphosphatase
MIKFIINLDTSLFYLVNHNMRNIYFDNIMPFLTNPKNFYIIFLIIWCLMVFSSKYRYRVAGWSIIIAVTISDILSSKLLKHLILRQRPFEVLPNVYKLVSSAGPSFPSSHAVNSFTVATLIMLFFKNPVYTTIAYVIAFLSAFSRVYVGVHYPLDVIAGAIIGVIIGICCYKIVKKIFKLNENDKNINEGSPTDKR